MDLPVWIAIAVMVVIAGAAVLYGVVQRRKGRADRATYDSAGPFV